MEVPAEMIDADLERQFADWGVTVTHQLVSVSFDPETLTSSETLVETELTALASTNKAGAAAGTGGHYLDSQTAFTFRTSDLPAADAGQLRRLVFSEIVYDVIGADILETNRVTILRCRERAES
jgi:hypothetical protein